MVASALDKAKGFRPGVVIPVYNHAEAIGITLERVLQCDIDVLLVDDGSDQECNEVLLDLSKKFYERVNLLVLAPNGGKGNAVKAGLKALLADGYSHGVQIDADGQHDISDLPDFIAAARDNPDALITGYPEYDESVPRLRYYSRYLTHVWVWINTLSFEIRDSMCGFRVYPLASVVQLLEQEKCGQRMDFDPEVIVRWLWRGGRVTNRPTRVDYPLDGVLHFDLWNDNVLITLMHTRLFFGMLRRLPKLLWRKMNG